MFNSLNNNIIRSENFSLASNEEILVEIEKSFFTKRIFVVNEPIDTIDGSSMLVSCKPIRCMSINDDVYVLFGQVNPDGTIFSNVFLPSLYNLYTHRPIQNKINIEITDQTIGLLYLCQLDSDYINNLKSSNIVEYSQYHGYNIPNGFYTEKYAYRHIRSGGIIINITRRLSRNIYSCPGNIPNLMAIYSTPDIIGVEYVRIGGNIKDLMKSPIDIRLLYHNQSILNKIFPDLSTRIDNELKSCSQILDLIDASLASNADLQHFRYADRNLFLEDSIEHFISTIAWSKLNLLEVGLRQNIKNFICLTLNRIKIIATGGIEHFNDNPEYTDDLLILLIGKTSCSEYVFNNDELIVYHDNEFNPLLKINCDDDMIQVIRHFVTIVDNEIHVTIPKSTDIIIKIDKKSPIYDNGSVYIDSRESELRNIVILNDNVTLTLINSIKGRDTDFLTYKIEIINDIQYNYEDILRIIEPFIHELNNHNNTLNALVSS